MKMNVLVVTDHVTHSPSNSLYELVVAIDRDPRSGTVWVCSRGVIENNIFFSGEPVEHVYATQVTDAFAFNKESSVLRKTSVPLSLADIDGILIRMPQPLDKKFLISLGNITPEKRTLQVAQQLLWLNKLSVKITSRIPGFWINQIKTNSW